MEITQLYALVLAAIVAAYVSFYFLRLIIGFLVTYAAIYFLKHIYYPPITRSIRAVKNVSRFEMILILIFLAINILAITLSRTDFHNIIRRMGVITTINLVVLAFGSRLNLVASRCGVGSDQYERFHRWLGWITTAEGFVHGLTAWIYDKPSFSRPSTRAAIVSGAASILLCLSTFNIIQNRMYEVFAKFHLAIAMLIIASTWWHIGQRNPLTPPTLYLLISLFTWLAVTTLRFANLFYRNYSRRKDHTQAVTVALPDVLHIYVKVARPWRFRAGQYVYLTIPRIGRWGQIQSHPLMISSWSNGPLPNDSAKEYEENVGYDTILLLAMPRDGFTARLEASADHVPLDEEGNMPLMDPRSIYISGGSEKMKALIEGPYGRELDLSLYGTVFLIATGIGIAAQLPYLKQLVENLRTWDSKTRRVALYWEIEAERHVYWVTYLMNEILDDDSGNILDIRVFIRGNFLSTEAYRGRTGSASQHQRLRMIYNALDVETELGPECRQVKGKMVVSTCVKSSMRSKIRTIVASNASRNIRLEELDFRPWRTRNSGS